MPLTPEEAQEREQLRLECTRMATQFYLRKQDSTSLDVRRMANELFSWIKRQD